MVDEHCPRFCHQQIVVVLLGRTHPPTDSQIEQPGMLRHCSAPPPRQTRLIACVSSTRTSEGARFASPISGAVQSLCLHLHTICHKRLASTTRPSFAVLHPLPAASVRSCAVPRAQMRHLATYMLLVLGGNAAPTKEDVTTALAAVGVDVSSIGFVLT